MNILITGGCGYVGSVLTGALLHDGHQVTVYDVQWFGNYLEPHPNLRVFQGDIRDVGNIPMEGMDSIIHLANIANDPGVDLNPILSWEVNVLAARELADAAEKHGIGHIIYASSGSVYGIKEEEEVTEDLSLVPISVYNKTKMVAERVLLSYRDNIKVHCIRPATVCGWSPRMRLDVAVNMLTFQALQDGEIKVLGGSQTRPNIHIKDLVNVYRHFLLSSDIDSGCFNAGFENLTILGIAELISSKIESKILIEASNDPRSYRQNSDKLLSTGYVPEYCVADAVDEIIKKYQEGLLEYSDRYHTVKWMRKLSL